MYHHYKSGINLLIEHFSYILCIEDLFIYTHEEKDNDIEKQQTLNYQYKYMFNCPF